MFFYNESDSEVSQAALATSDPYFYNTSLLLKMDSDFSDSSIHQHTTTTGGNIAVSNSEFKYGGGSGYFDGVSSTGLSVPASAQLNLNGVDWTIEAWIKPNGNYSTYNEMFHNGADWDFWLAPTTGQITFYSPSGQVSTGVAPQVNQWSHIAAVRSGGTVTIYLDGTSIGSATINLSYSGNPLGIGNVASLNNYPFAGHIDDVRITKGVARYTANFAPPDSLPTTGPGIVTDSLTLNLDIGDNTSYAGTGTTVNNIAGSDTATLTGNILFSSDNEGYLDFDGADDTMGVANGSSVDITDAITLEAWVNPDVVIGWISLIYKDNSQVSQGYHFGFDPSGRLQGGVRNSGIWRTTQPGAVAQMYVGQWQHIVMSMDSTTNVQKFYINGALVYTNSNFIYEVLSNTNPLSISGQPITGVEKYNGKLAKAALYSRALTDAEVEQNFNALKSRFGL